MSSLLRPTVAAMMAYVPGEQPRSRRVIKLNTNENPYGPSPHVRAALKTAVNSALRLYPEPLSDALRCAAARVYDVRPENILAGNGSDELLAIAMRSFVAPGSRVAYPVPTYSLYDTLVTIHDAQAACVNYPEDFSLPRSLAAQQAALTVLCNPNSPSGTLIPVREVEQLARSVPGVLIVDEAYVDFASSEQPSALPLIRKLENLVVLRSFSKSFSLAGMRVGLAFACEDLIAGMTKVKDSYNVNRLSSIAATAALQDLNWMSRNVRRIQSSRKKLTAGLEALGYYVHPSHANFVLAQKKEESLHGMYEALKERNIFVRYFVTSGLHDCVRITVGSPAEVAALLRALKVIAKKNGQLSRTGRDVRIAASQGG